MAKSSTSLYMSDENKSWLALMASIRSIREGKQVSASDVANEIFDEARERQLANPKGMEKIIKAVQDVSL